MLDNSLHCGDRRCYCGFNLHGLSLHISFDLGCISLGFSLNLCHFCGRVDDVLYCGLDYLTDVLDFCFDLLRYGLLSNGKFDRVLDGYWS